MYIGRFAPTPSGPLHFGSIVTALASYLDAKYHNGIWKIRIDDLDTPRILKGAEKSILNRLESLELFWDNQISYQSKHIDQYKQAVEKLQALNLIYPCECTRKEISSTKIIGIDGPIYNNVCRFKHLKKDRKNSIRLRVNSNPIEFKDLIQGSQYQNLKKFVGDFVIKRSDELFAYQLGVVVDDGLQSITHVVRGSDLLNSTSRQIYIQSLLNLPTIRYLHLPLAVIHGKKLSKGYRDRLSSCNPNIILVKALIFMNQEIDIGLENETPREIIKWAIKHWDIDRISKKIKIELDPTTIKSTLAL